MIMRQMQTVLRSMREIVEDAEFHLQPAHVCREFARLRAEAVALHASWFPGPPDGGEVAELSLRAGAAGLTRGQD
ncbi:hypothetical protein [Deinococcus sp. UYEF24]